MELESTSQGLVSLQLAEFGVMITTELWSSMKLSLTKSDPQAALSPFIYSEWLSGTARLRHNFMASSWLLPGTEHGILRDAKHVLHDGALTLPQQNKAV